MGGFMAFGVVAKGIFQHRWYTQLLPHITRALTRNQAALTSLLLDCFGWVPIGYYPVYYIITGGIVHQRGPSESIRAYRTDAPEALKTYYMFWLPIQFANFMFVQCAWRNVVVLGSSGLWMMVMSWHQAALAARKTHGGNSGSPKQNNDLDSA